jgi:hypothetical protein
MKKKAVFLVLALNCWLQLCPLNAQTAHPTSVPLILKGAYGNYSNLLEVYNNQATPILKGSFSAAGVFEQRDIARFGSSVQMQFSSAGNSLSATTSTSGASANPFTLQSQGVASSNGSGGDLNLYAGSGSGSATNGNVFIRAGNTTSVGSVTTGGNITLQTGKSSDGLDTGNIVFKGYKNTIPLTLQTLGTLYGTSGDFDLSGGLQVGGNNSSNSRGIIVSDATAGGVGVGGEMVMASSYSGPQQGYLLTNWNGPGLLTDTYARNGGSSVIIMGIEDSAGEEIAPGDIHFLTAPSGTAGDSITWTQRFAIDQSGFTGVNDASPDTYFDVQNTVAKATNVVVDSMYLSSNDSSNPFRLNFQMNGNSTARDRSWAIQSTETGVANRNLLLNPHGGNIGVGSTQIPGESVTLCFDCKLGWNGDSGTVDVKVGRSAANQWRVNTNAIDQFSVENGFSDALTGLKIGQGAEITQHLSGTASLDFDFSSAGITCQDLTITVTGAADGDTVKIGVPNAAVTTGVQYFGWVSTTNTVTVRGCDLTNSDHNPSAQTFRADVDKH